MSPSAEVSGLDSPVIYSNHMADQGEVDEHSRAAWRNTIVTVSDRIIFNQKYNGDYSVDGLVAMLVSKLGMPFEIASQLIEKAYAHQVGFAVECNTIFEQNGRIGGPRRYENFRIREPA